MKNILGIVFLLFAFFIADKCWAGGELVTRKDVYLGIGLPEGSVALGVEDGLMPERYPKWADFMVGRQSFLLEVRYKPWNDLFLRSSSSLGLGLEPKIFLIGRSLSGPFLGVHTMFSWEQYSADVYSNGVRVGHQMSEWGFSWANKFIVGYQWTFKSGIVLSPAFGYRFWKYEWARFQDHRNVLVVGSDREIPRESLELNLGWAF